MDKDTRLLRIGIGGSAIAALCCFTPILVVLLGAVGAAAWVGYLDYVLFPAVAIFVGMTAYAWHRRRQARPCCTSGNIGGKE
jgi:mercuric ion transport protein